MIWKLLLEGRLASKSDGTEVFYFTPVQDWGLQVKDLQVGVEVVGRSSALAKLHVYVDDGLESDINALTTPQSTPTSYEAIVLVTVSAQLPAQFRGTQSGTKVPYFRLRIGVAGAAGGSVEEYLQLRVYAGGKAY